MSKKHEVKERLAFIGGAVLFIIGSYIAFLALFWWAFQFEVLW